MTGQMARGWLWGPYSALALAIAAPTAILDQAHKWWMILGLGIAEKKPTVGLNLVMLALKQVMKNPNVDLNRIYVTGVSMGAYGVWDILRRNPKLFAAAIPMSYGGDPSTAKSIARIPISTIQTKQRP